MPQISQLTDAEWEWVEACLNCARSIVTSYVSAEAGQRMSADDLDAAWAAWFDSLDADPGDVNPYINSFAAALGVLLKESAGFDWVIAQDDQSTELAMLALPGRGDALVYPANMVAKRWVKRERNFFANLLDRISSDVRMAEAGNRS